MPVSQCRAASPHATDLILGISPLERSDARLVSAVCRAGAMGILDLGNDPAEARRASTQLAFAVPDGFGVRISAADPESSLRLVEERHLPVGTIVLAAHCRLRPGDLPSGPRVLVEVTSLDDAVAAASAGAHGVILRGSEVGGRVGDLSNLVLLQQVLSDDRVGIAIWMTGVGPLGAAAAVAAGAAGVVLDTQLCLLAESDMDAETARMVRASDGTQAELVDGVRGHRRRALDRNLSTGDAFLPLGQDSFLASALADVHHDVKGVVNAYRAEILSSVEDTTTGLTLGSPGAGERLLGTPLPVAQGPMTRVSDRAEFAAEVATAGGLPFVALALSNAEQTRRLLLDTAALLGDKPWGVGILGFVPEEVRAAQLEVIRDLKPRYAVLAGGRPTQVAQLEQAGVTTYLHVPSPVLLDQSLTAGVRRFVFEGAECGGHIGPRHSLLLWEAQIRVLVAHLDGKGAAKGEDICVLFAGGIHDARSAAMVSVMVRPLVSRAVGVGILMGTAYLFTEEAVRAGAITPAFQRQVVGATRTALLETAPGHVTRCVDSPYAGHFQQERARLHRERTPQRRMWQELEDLNLGRLRVAAKGVRRAADAIMAIGEADQLADGLFMAGDVAVLRDRVTTIAELHGNVTVGAANFLAQRQAAAPSNGPGSVAPNGQLTAAAPVGVRTGRRTAPAPVDVAIIGMACLFPRANDVAEYWTNILDGLDAVAEVPADRWDINTFFRAGSRRQRIGDVGLEVGRLPQASSL